MTLALAAGHVFATRLFLFIDESSLRSLRHYLFLNFAFIHQNCKIARCSNKKLAHFWTVIVRLRLSQLSLRKNDFSTTLTKCQGHREVSHQRCKCKDKFRRKCKVKAPVYWHTTKRSASASASARKRELSKLEACFCTCFTCVYCQLIYKRELKQRGSVIFQPFRIFFGILRSLNVTFDSRLHLCLHLCLSRKLKIVSQQFINNLPGFSLLPGMPCLSEKKRKRRIRNWIEFKRNNVYLLKELKRISYLNDLLM